jgi:hypothetical protein
VLLSEYEEVLPLAWTECFARMTRGYDTTTALAQVVNAAAAKVGADVCLYDVGPNVGRIESCGFARLRLFHHPGSRRFVFPSSAFDRRPIYRKMDY